MKAVIDRSGCIGCGLCPTLCPEVFAMAEDGSIAFAQGIAGPHALFTLSLDESKADPAAVDDFLERRDINPMLGFAD